MTGYQDIPLIALKKERFQIESVLKPIMLLTPLYELNCTPLEQSPKTFCFKSAHEY